MNIDFWAFSISVTLLLAALAFTFRFGKWYGEVNSDRANFRALINEIRNDIKDILLRIPSSLVTSSSPLRLTELGEKLSKNINAADWANAEAENLIAKTKGKNPYEIQSIAFDFAKEFEPTGDMRKKMQICAFENGIELSEVRNVLSVELRDVLLKHYGLHQSALDVQD